MNALTSLRPKSDLLNWTKFEDTIFRVRLFYKSQDINPSQYPRNTPINIGIENEGEISMPTNPQILINIYEVIQDCLLV